VFEAMLATKVAFLLAALSGSGFALEDDSEGSPIEKVITMMEDLMTETLVEGKAEAKTYDKFACFCKDNTNEKTEAIEENTDKLAELEATIQEQVAKRTSLDNQIEESSTIIAEKQKGLDEADAKRKKDNEDFKTAEADCFTFKKEIDFAVVELMAGEFLQLKTVITKHKEKGTEALQTAVQEYMSQNPDMSQDERDFIKTNLLETEGRSQSAGVGDSHKSATGGVVKTVKELKPGMEETLKRLRADEVQSKHEYQMVVQGLTQEKTAEQKVLDDAQKTKAKNTEEMGQNSKDMTMTQAELTDDQQFLKTLTENCNSKSKMWDQRSKARAEELTAITNAITIVKSKVATKSGKTVRFIQRDSSAPKTAMIQEESEDSQSSYDEVLQVADEEEDPEAISFLQLSPRKRAISLLAKPLDGDRIVAQVERKIEKSEDFENMTPAQKQLARATALSKVASTVSTGEMDPMAERKQETEKSQKTFLVKFLKGKADSLKSTRLAAIAAQVSTTGPFDKITKLIQELIERLMQEAADEANHEGWCNTQLGKAKGARERKAESVLSLNDAMAKAENLRDKLQEETAKLGSEIDELTATLEKMTKERNDEAAENEATIKESEEGKAAVDEALDMLTKFYKTAAKNKVLLEKDSSDQTPDMPDAGFDEAYGGSQGAATGILGMLEVISGDFARTIKTTKEAEKKSAADFLAFETETKTSLAVKTNTKSAKENELTETIDELADSKTSLEEDQSLLDKALQELIELEPACFPKAEPYEVRVAKREQEIESLKTALCTLDKEGPVQTEAGDCGSL
jgi:hypothetical protein